MARRKRKQVAIYFIPTVIGIVAGLLLLYLYGFDIWLRSTLIWVYALTILTGIVAGLIAANKRWKILKL